MIINAPIPISPGVENFQNILYFSCCQPANHLKEQPQLTYSLVYNTIGLDTLIVQRACKYTHSLIEHPVTTFPHSFSPSTTNYSVCKELEEGPTTLGLRIAIMLLA